MKPPTSFLGGGGYGVGPARPARVVEVPSAAEPALLTVHADSRATLSKALRRAAGLKHGQRFDLVVPRHPGGSWYLDTNPKPGAGYTLPANPDARCVVRLRPLPARLFSRPRPKARNEDGLYTSNTNELAERLSFVLGPELADTPGYYQLRAVSSGTVNQ